MPTSRQTRQVGGADPPSGLGLWRVMLMLLQCCSSQCLQEPELALAGLVMGLGQPRDGVAVLSAAGGGFRELGWAGEKLLPKITLTLLCFCFMMSFSLLLSLHFSLQALLEAPFLQETGDMESTCLLTGTLSGA